MTGQTELAILEVMKNLSIIWLALGVLAFAFLGGLATAGYRATNPSVEAPAVAPSLAELSPVAENIQLPPIYIEQVAKLKSGQTLATILSKENFNNQDIHYAARTLGKVYNLRRMRPNDEFMFTYQETVGQEPPTLLMLSLFTDADKYIQITRQEDNTYKSVVDERTIFKVPRIAQGEISASLYVAAQNAGLPDALIVPFIEMFSWDLDFTRDIREGDKFRIMYEEILDENNEFIRYGDILAGEIDTARQGRTVSAFMAQNGKYYDADGRSKKRALLRTPIKFTRISSGFNPHRKHPVLGYTRAHKGTDFAAPTGTPIKASGDGTIVEMGWKGGYGRYIRIRHNSTFETAYAHMSRYGRGMRTGKRVQQGDVIGYVGMSGTATGPHLHYEVLVNRRQVNAMRVKLPQGDPLPTLMRTAFKQQVELAKKEWLQDAQLAKADEPQQAN